MRALLIILLSLLFVDFAWVQETEDDIVKRAALLKPHERQVAWQELEYTCFIHFGPNTFSDREWGTGKEDPNVFQPTGLDTDQWAKAAKDAGMKLMLLTVKHHDGFCLWQTKYEKHGVRSTSWRDGKGDVLRDLSESCRKYDLKLGVYLSPADLYQIENEKGLYGNGSKKTHRVIPTPVDGWPTPKKVAEFRHELDDYNAYFMNQLYELLTEYGPVHEVWFDGAHPKRKGGQTYDYDLWFNLIRRLAPDAVIAVKGPDVRWIGNEAGHARKSEWSVIPLQEDPSNFKWPDLRGADLGSRAKIKNAKFFHWHPAEMNTSIRPGWFYHKNQNGRVKSLEQLLNVYYTGVGGNAVFLLNIPPDQRGLFHENDVARLKDLAYEINATFDVNLAAQAKVKASKAAAGHDAEKTLDDDTRSFWSPGDGNSTAELEYDLGEQNLFDRAMLQEAITEGQRIENFVLEGKQGSEWKEIARGTTVGYKKLMRFPAVEAQHVRLRITQSRLNPTLSNFGLFRAPVRVTNPLIQRDKNGMVKIFCKPAVPEIRYTIEDGPDKTETYKIYDKDFALHRGGTVTAMAYDPAQNMVSEIVEKTFDIAKSKWKVVFASSEQPSHGEGKEKAIDGDPNTIWHSRWTPDKPKHPHEIHIDLGETLMLKGFTYLPRQADHLTGAMIHYEFYVSSDGKSWGKPTAKGEFSNIKNNPVDQVVTFEKAVEGRFIRLVGLDEVNGKPYTSAAEIGVITR